MNLEWFDKALGKLPARSQRFGLLGVVAVVIALALEAAGIAAAGFSISIVFALVGAVAFVVALASLFLPDRTPRIVEKADAAAPGGRVVFGLEVEWDGVRYGIVDVEEVEADERRLLPAAGERDIRTSPVGRESVEGTRRGAADAYYDAMVAAVRGMVEERPEGVAGIGIAIPGIVNPIQGTVVEARLQNRRYFPANEAVGRELARRLAGDGHVRRALGVAATRAEDELAERIVVDNDVRCMTRQIMSKENDKEEWRNYVCVFLGDQGVGTGIVFEKKLYYGANAMAGEAGHVTLAVGADEDRCKCGKAGRHWETLVRGELLDKAAESRWPEEFEQARSAPLTDTDAYRTRFGRAAFLRATRDDDESGEQVRGAIDNYAVRVGVGIANLMNILDVDHIVLAGDVAHDLWKLADGYFREQVVVHATDYALDRPKGFDLEPRAVEAWVGAALIFWDPSFPRWRSREAVSRLRESPSEVAV